MKKIFGLLLVLFASISLIACGKQLSDEELVRKLLEMDNSVLSNSGFGGSIEMRTKLDDVENLATIDVYFSAGTTYEELVVYVKYSTETADAKTTIYFYQIKGSSYVEIVNGFIPLKYKLDAIIAEDAYLDIFGADSPLASDFEITDEIVAQIVTGLEDLRTQGIEIKGELQGDKLLVTANISGDYNLSVVDSKGSGKVEIVFNNLQLESIKLEMIATSDSMEYDIKGTLQKSELVNLPSDAELALFIPMDNINVGDIIGFPGALPL